VHSFLNASSRFGFGTTRVLGVEQIPKGLADFFFGRPIPHFIPILNAGFRQLLDEASTGRRVSHRVDNVRDDLTLFVLARGRRIGLRKGGNEVPKANIARGIVRRFATRTQDIVLAKRKIGSELALALGIAVQVVGRFNVVRIRRSIGIALHCVMIVTVVLVVGVVVGVVFLVAVVSDALERVFYLL